MANKKSLYRDPSVQSDVQDWFDQSKTNTYPLSSQFWYYTRWITNNLDQRMGSIMSYHDFARCLYSIGVVDVRAETGTEHSWRQLPNWRPSLDQIKRLKVPSLYE